MTSNVLAPVLIAAIFVAIAIAWIVWSVRDLPFDSVRWRTKPSQRLCMAHWMVKREYLLGKSRSEVMNLLGPPSEAPWFKPSDWDLVFDLCEVTFYLDSLGLAVKFDNDEFVAACAVVAG
ncbi:MAG TPA: hypothetical protein VGP63_08090 [Planctomycetaceae bacterium]|nr:hypothetical protein [Planctomycetaceae bacterium]